MTVLALEFRPATFSDVVGQTHIKPILLAMARDQSVPPSLLFVGSRGTGKTTIGRIFSAALNCERSQTGDACAECPSCLSVQSGSSLSVLEVDAASHGLIEDVRQIQELIQYDAVGAWRVVMLDEAHSMGRAAFNAMLKMLEEPPPQVVFILLTTEAPKIPETIVSRSMTFMFRRITVDDIRGRLEYIAQEKKIGVSPELLTEIAVRAQGGMRDAVMTLDQCSRVGIDDLKGFYELFGIQDIAVPLLRAAATANYTEGAALIDEYFRRIGDAQSMVTDLVSLLRDVGVVLHSGIPEDSNEVGIGDRRDLAALLSTAKVVKATQVLWELRARTRAVDNDHRAAMDLAFVLLANALCPEEVAGPIHQEAQEEPMSLEQMEQAVAQFRQERAG